MEMGLLGSLRSTLPDILPWRLLISALFTSLKESANCRCKIIDFPDNNEDVEGGSGTGRRIKPFLLLLRLESLEFTVKGADVTEPSWDSSSHEDIPT